MRWLRWAPLLVTALLSGRAALARRARAPAAAQLAFFGFEQLDSREGAEGPAAISSASPPLWPATAVTEGVAHDFLQKCLYVPTPICYDAGRNVITRRAAWEGLVAHYSFDGLFSGFDESAHANHFHPGLRAAPGAGAGGSSGFIPGGLSAAAVRVPSEELRSVAAGGNDWTLTLAVYPLWSANDTIAQTLSLLCVGGTAVGVSPGGGFFAGATKSAGVLLPRAWTDLAVVAEGGKTTIFFNGVPAAGAAAAGAAAAGGGAAPAESTTLTLGSCGSYRSGEFYVDDLRLFSRALSAPELRAFLSRAAAAPATPACAACGLAQAAAACPPDTRLCSSAEMKSFGYRLARRLGLMEEAGAAWELEDASGDTAAEDELRLAVCCGAPPAEAAAAGPS